MKILLYTISKSLPLEPIYTHYKKLCRGFGAEIVCKNIFNREIVIAQKTNPKSAQESYTKALNPLLLQHQANNIALHKEGRSLDSAAFANLLAQRSKVAFFIGGAFGFEEKFLAKTTPISLSPLTFSHTIVGIIELEQIYRSLSILAHHPYHK